MADNDDLLDYEEEEQTETTVAEVAEPAKKEVKGTYVSIHSSGFRDFLLKPEILRAIVDCGFEHPSEGKSAAHSIPPPYPSMMTPTDRDIGILKILSKSICSEQPIVAIFVFPVTT